MVKIYQSLTCHICFEEFSKKKRVYVGLKCGHQQFHKTCLQKCFKAECPTCRRPHKLKVTGPIPESAIVFNPADYNVRVSTWDLFKMYLYRIIVTTILFLMGIVNLVNTTFDLELPYIITDFFFYGNVVFTCYNLYINLRS